MYYFTNLWEQFNHAVPSVVIAALILVLAFISAAIVKFLVQKLMQVIKIDVAFKKAGIEDERKDKLKEFIAKLAYLVVFVLFLPGIFQKLGLTDVASPIVAMMNKFMVYLPNIIAAIVLLIVGIFLAKTVKELLVPIFKKLKMDEWLHKIGFESKSGTSIAEFVANAIYVLIIIPVVIAALNTLNIAAISEPAVNMLNQILVFVPRIAVAVVILFIGKFIANLVFQVLEKLLISIGTDKFANSVSKATKDESENQKENEFSLSKVIAYIVKYVIITIFLVEAVKVLMLDVLTNIGNAVIAYIPSAISAIIIIGACILVGSYVKKIILKKFPENPGVALGVKVLIITIGGFITLYQLGIAKEMINSAFIIILGALAVAFAISFGIGGRDFASNMLKRVEKKIDKKDE